MATGLKCEERFPEIELVTLELRNDLLDETFNGVGEFPHLHFYIFVKGRSLMMMMIEKRRKAMEGFDGAQGICLTKTMNGKLEVDFRSVCACAKG